MDDFEKIKILRSVSEQHINKDDKNGMPIMNKVTEKDIDVENMQAINIQNVSVKNVNSQHIIFPFRYDKDLRRYWNNPFFYIPLFSSAMAVCSPDFSVYPSMHYEEVRHNIFQNRWLGCLWQDMGCIVIPTVSWALPDSYDVCLSGIQNGSVVAISTIGCHKVLSRELFMQGFNEMKKRINPSLIIVYGKMFPDMTGNFVNVKYDEGFEKKNKALQLQLFKISKKFIVKEGV